MNTGIPLLYTKLEGLPLLRRGKVRDIYEIGDRLLIVATDRISAFDVIMSEGVPGKGRILTAISKFWFERLQHFVPHHLISGDVDEIGSLTPEERELLRDRIMIVEKTQPLPVECVVRGYLAGSGWKEYKDHSTVCGIRLRDGYQESSRLDEPIFTPATKAQEGHDENIDFGTMQVLVGETIADTARIFSLAIYQNASAYARERGLILADTKFEFGLRADGSLILIDEALTPDSSRYWLTDSYAEGKSVMNFDKQVLRDWLEESGWNKLPPPPALPDAIIEITHIRYKEAYERLTGVAIEDSQA